MVINKVINYVVINRIVKFFNIVVLLAIFINSTSIYSINSNVFSNLKKTIASKVKRDKFVLVLDPGHGGKFSGCQFEGLKEKDLTLQVSKRLKQKLIKHGIKVVLTRNGDYHLDNDLPQDLTNRVKACKDNNANLFISLHVNSKPQKQVRGYEIYVPYGSKFPIESYLVASVVHHNLSNFAESNWVGNGGGVNGFDRGIRAAKFKVLSNSNCPAILIELDYLSNPAICKKFKEGSFQNKLADILSKAIVTYVKGKKHD